MGLRNLQRGRGWLLGLFLLAAGLLPLGAAAQDKPQEGAVQVGVRTAFVLESSVGSISPADRAAIVNRRIAQILSDPQRDPARIAVGQLPNGTTAVLLGNFPIVEVTEAEATANDTTVEQLAKERARILRSEITQVKPLYLARGKVNIKTLSEHRILLLIVQVVLLLLAARICGELMARIGQPPVIGQLLAGILLGRSVFGALAPNVHALIFPVEATQSYLLEVVSWLGVIFLLMLTGMETDIALIRQQGKPAFWTAVTGIVAPFICGLAVGYVLPTRLLTTPEQRTILAIFLGTALSVSSVPVIAKILMDMKLLRRNVGQVILAAALTHDTVGWIILAVVAGLAGSGGFNGLVLARALFGTLIFAAFSLTLGQRWVNSLLRWIHDNLRGEQALLTSVVVLMLLSAGITQFIGVHAVLGAFLMGVVLSGSSLVGKKVIEPIEALTMGVFAPIFFAAAGLQVNLGILFSPPLLLITGLFTGAACLGKIAGCYAGGRWGGLGKWEALSIGLGTNARGAMGLIISILGFSLGILTIDMFSIIVVMAVITTAMTPPLLRWALAHVQPGPEEQTRLEQEERHAHSFLSRIRRVLLPTSGGPHTQFAARLVHAIGTHYPIEVTALHVAAPGSDSASDAPFASLMPSLCSDKLTALTKTVQAPHAVEGILEEASKGYDLLLLGCGNDPASAKRIFGRFTDAVADAFPGPLLVVRAPAGVSSIEEWNLARILVPTTGLAYGGQAAELAIALARAAESSVSALYVVEEQMQELFYRVQEHEPPTELARQVVSQVAALGEPFGVPVEAVVRTAAQAAPEIVRVARQTQTDLILLSGSRRPTERLFLGSTISYVLNHAQCAVAVLKP